MFQVFQLTALAFRGPVTSGERFTVSWDWVAIREEVVRSVLLCVRDFVRDPVLTQRSFFSETGAATLSEATAISDSIISSSFYARWSEVESVSSRWVIADLTTCFQKALDRRRVVKDTSKEWYALGAVRPSSSESSLQHGVRISPVVEEWEGYYVPVAALSRRVSGLSRHVSSPGKGKKKLSRSPVKLPRQFEVASPSVSSPKTCCGR